MPEQDVNLTIEQFKQLFARKRAAVEEERIACAKELHDEVSQQLTVLTMELALLQQRLGIEAPESEKVAELMDMMAGVNKTVRNVTNRLRPKILDAFGLVPALKYECQRIQKEQKLQVAFSSATDDVSLDENTATETFRLFQLVIAHLIKGAQPKQIRIVLAPTSAALIIEIAADAEHFEQTGDGFAWMDVQECGAWIGAEIQVSAHPGECLVTLTIPGADAQRP